MQRHQSSGKLLALLVPRCSETTAGERSGHLSLVSSGWAPRSLHLSLLGKPETGHGLDPARARKGLCLGMCRLGLKKPQRARSLQDLAGWRKGMQCECEPCEPQEQAVAELRQSVVSVRRCLREPHRSHPTTSHYRTPDELKATSAAACAQNAGGSPARPGKKIFAGPRKRARKRAAPRWLLGTARCSRVWLGASTHCPKGRCKRSILKTLLMSALARELLSCPVATAQRHAQPSGSGCLGGGSPKLDSTTIPLNGPLLQCTKIQMRRWRLCPSVRGKPPVLSPEPG